MIRWYIDIQKFHYTLEDILGYNNPISDVIFYYVTNMMTATDQSSFNFGSHSW